MGALGWFMSVELSRSMLGEVLRLVLLFGLFLLLFVF
jgi:hypothetical protein